MFLKLIIKVVIRFDRVRIGQVPGKKATLEAQYILYEIHSLCPATNHRYELICAIATDHLRCISLE